MLSQPFLKSLKSIKKLPVLKEIPEKTAIDGSVSESDCKVTTVLPPSLTPEKR